MIPRSLAATRSVVVLGLAVWASASAGQPLDTIGIEEIHRGQQGYGLSVFEGDQPQRFEVEVLGVLHRSTPELSYILARLAGQGLERSGVAGGMSGSPVYLDGRLAGAVAFSYVFGLDPIAGITPIGGMRRLSELPAEGPAPAEPLVELPSLVARKLPAGLLEQRLAELRPPSAAARTSLVWSAGGFTPRVTAMLEPALGLLAPAGGAAEAPPLELHPGSAVAAVLVSGDLSLAASGTVTDRRGDEILAFGHPIFSLGPVALPMASAEVITVMASRASSFKLSNAGPPVGAFDQDREAGLRGRLGAEAPTIPLVVRLRGLVDKEYRMQLADLPQLSPTLMAIASLGALDAASYAFGPQALDLTLRFALAGFEDLELRQSFDGDQAAVDSVVYLMSFASFLALNRYERVGIEGVEVELEQAGRPRTALLISAHAERSHVEPGGEVAITLELQAYRGERIRREVRVRIPDHVPEGPFVVLVGDGTSMDSARLTIERREPVTFQQALDLLRSFHSRRELAVLGLIADPGVAVAGEVLPQLPGSVRSIFAASGSRNGSPIWLTIAGEQVETLQMPIEGVQRVDLEIKRRER